jgi:hypothetical protein
LKIVDEAGPKELDVVVLRQGKKHSLKITPAERPSTLELNVQAKPTKKFDDIERFFLDQAAQAGIKNSGIDFHLVGPGVAVLPERPTAVKLPDNVSIRISKQGDQPARIEVRRGDDRWNVSDDKLGDLPEDLRPHVARLLGRQQNIRARTTLDAVRSIRLPDLPKAESGPARITIRPNVTIDKPVAPPKAVAVLSRPGPAAPSLERKLDDVLRKLDELIKELRVDRKE